MASSCVRMSVRLERHQINLFYYTDEIVTAAEFPTEHEIKLFRYAIYPLIPKTA